jgi:hypothetical protein
MTIPKKSRHSGAADCVVIRHPGQAPGNGTRAGIQNQHELQVIFGIGSCFLLVGSSGMTENGKQRHPPGDFDFDIE